MTGGYDVIVVGAGHAGCEAALAAARMGCRTLMLTMNLDQVALMPCNPSIGGPAKGHLVREVDALGGEMGICADRTLLQMRLLNDAKGPAVRALRAQIDKKAYQAAMLQTLLNQERLEVRQGEVIDLVVDEGRVRGVVTRSGMVLPAGTVVLTTGTYLRGRIVVGELAYRGGPAGQLPAARLGRALARRGLTLQRFKTGTPSRVARRSVDFSSLEEQQGTLGAGGFSFLTRGPVAQRCVCWLTYTTPASHAIIYQNLDRAPLYNGRIHGIGPRYCPSIEDKVVRFADAERHQIFLEPEGLGSEEIYLQGLSTSLPEEVQVALVRSIPGLERAELVRFGYAIEYDCLDPTQLWPTLEVKNIRGLFTAGQVNGTSGYEEAAAQGLLAGINAALQVQGREALVLGRSEAYIGVLIDDLVTGGTAEPYRMLTSRAEYRLLLRQDNADLRLTEKGYAVGLASEERRAQAQERAVAVAALRDVLRSRRARAGDVRVEEMLARRSAGGLRPGSTAEELLRRPGVGYADLVGCGLAPAERADVAVEVETQVKYAGYIERQGQQVARMRRMEERPIPPATDYRGIAGLSREGREKLQRVQPQSVGQASRIPGVTPGDIAVLLVYLEQLRREGRPA